MRIHEFYNQTVPHERLIFVSGTAANVRQGSGTYVGIAALRRALWARGCEVELIAPARTSPAAWRRLWFNWRLRRHAWPPDATVVGFDWDGLFLSAAPIACIKGVLAEEMRFERGLPRARLWLQSRLEARRARRARLVLATSAYAASALQRRYRVPAARLRIVPELLDVAAWRQALASASRTPHPAPTILCVAHLYPRKDVATLLRALALLPTAVHVRIAGGGPEAGNLRRLAARLGLGSRACFLGHISHAALASEYRNADLFCLPSRQEGFGIVLLEAMAAGLPIVAARAAAIPEVVPDPDCGLLFPPGDAPTLAAHLQRLLEDPALCRQMSTAAQLHVTRYDASTIAGQFLSALNLRPKAES